MKEKKKPASNSLPHGQRACVLPLCSIEKCFKVPKFASKRYQAKYKIVVEAQLGGLLPTRISQHVGTIDTPEEVNTPIHEQHFAKACSRIKSPNCQMYKLLHQTKSDYSNLAKLLSKYSKFALLEDLTISNKITRLYHKPMLFKVSNKPLKTNQVFKMHFFHVR